jgi:SAM-dependent MidA family methyltransferase
VERSAAARSAHRDTLAAAGVADVTSSDTLPSSFEGVLVANELLDAMPAHRVVMRDGGLRELYVEASGAALTTREGPVSSGGIAAQLAASGVTLASGAYADVPVAAVGWIRDAARALARGFMVLLDYGSEASALYGPARARGTLRTFRGHRVSDAGDDRWLDDPGAQDVTVDVDFTAVRRAAESEGCTVLGFMDQTYFLMALAEPLLESMDDRDRRAFKMLVMPGGLGSTMKVMVLGKGVGTPVLRGTSGPARLT